MGVSYATRRVERWWQIIYLLFLQTNHSRASLRAFLLSPLQNGPSKGKIISITTMVSCTSPSLCQSLAGCNRLRFPQCLSSMASTCRCVSTITKDARWRLAQLIWTLVVSDDLSYWFENVRAETMITGPAPLKGPTDSSAQALGCKSACQANLDGNPGQLCRFIYKNRRT